MIRNKVKVAPIELKRFLDTDFNTKNCFSALNLRLEYRFHHLIKTKTHLNTTLIGLIRYKQVEILSYNTEELKLNITEQKRMVVPFYNGMPKSFPYSLGNLLGDYLMVRKLTKYI